LGRRNQIKKKMIYNWEQFKLNENMSADQIKSVEQYADRLFQELGLDVEFTKHFKERLNDPRNQKPISPAELIGMFKRAFTKSGKKIAEMPPNAQAVIQDMRTDLNSPFVIEYDPNSKELDLTMKTIMRKKDFQTTNDKIVI